MTSPQTQASAADAPEPADPPPAPAAPAQAKLSPAIRRLRATRAVLWALVGVMTVAWLFYAGGLDSIRSTVSSTVASFTQPAPAPVTTADVGQAAPSLKLPLVGGGEVDLASYRGRPVLLNFWATWCDPCRAEMPVFERVQQQYRDRGLVVLGVDFQEQDPEIAAFRDEIGVTFPSLVDRTGEVTRQWRATGLPTTFLIDRQGVIQDVRVGAYTDDMLASRLTKLMGE